MLCHHRTCGSAVAYLESSCDRGSSSARPLPPCPISVPHTSQSYIPPDIMCPVSITYRSTAHRAPYRGCNEQDGADLRKLCGTGEEDDEKVEGVGGFHKELRQAPGAHHADDDFDLGDRQRQRQMERTEDDRCSFNEKARMRVKGRQKPTEDGRRRDRTRKTIWKADSMPLRMSWHLSPQSTSLLAEPRTSASDQKPPMPHGNKRDAGPTRKRQQRFRGWKQVMIAEGWSIAMCTHAQIL